MSAEKPDRSLGPRLHQLEEHLESVREEICDIPHISELNTGELIRVEETLSIAAETAKEVVSVKRRIRLDHDNGERPTAP